ncbi:CGNR zinc finger domain-containing protein [Streptosporangium sp. CA-135522]|uniref:CGNR zinc finger domain-containing protein n=1 Tax=Streptosporangium sp. CA-135522 TaxID=3240072 RepID=UPI003D8E3A2E
MSAPVMGEPLPIELANATYAVRGRLQDGLRTVVELAAWLEAVRGRLALPLPDSLEPTTADLAGARELRDGIRALATAATAGSPPEPDAVEAVNKHVRAAPRWRELSWDPVPAAHAHSSAPAVPAVLSAIAQQAVDLFTGPELADLRACHAPGCVLFFVKDHHRREWCSAACGNRARAARHYSQTRAK